MLDTSQEWIIRLRKDEDHYECIIQPRWSKTYSPAILKAIIGYGVTLDDASAQALGKLFDEVKKCEMQAKDVNICDICGETMGEVRGASPSLNGPRKFCLKHKI